MPFKQSLLCSLAAVWWFGLAAPPAVPTIQADTFKFISYIVKVNPKLSLKEARQITESVLHNADEYGVDPMLVFGMIQQESRFHPNIGSSAGALGLMQVVPAWSQKLIAGRDIKDIDVNINVGTRILRACMEQQKFVLDNALACYSGYHPSTVAVYRNQVMRFRANIIREIQNVRTRS